MLCLTQVSPPHPTPPHACLQWDVSFWAERLKEAKYALEEEQLRPFFALPNVLQVGTGALSSAGAVLD